MTCWVPRLCPAATTLVLALALALSGCAAAGGARPAAFPGAPELPAGLQPTGLRAPHPPGVAGLLRTAFSLRGTRYRFGGESPADGFDCSGFIRYLFGTQRMDVPRTVTEQFERGSTVGRNRIREGDLVFFSTVAPGASHVGLAIGNGAFIHAPGEGGAVRVDRLDAPYWHDRIVGVKRVL